MTEITEQIIVKQSRGKDSTIEVFQETRDTYAGPVLFLIFESDQVLDTGSGRSWNVDETIKNYCRKRGFKLGHRNGKYRIEAQYSHREHSNYLSYKLKDQVKNNERFANAVEQAHQIETALNDEYAPAIAQLKHLVFVLERKLNDKLGIQRRALKDLQAQILQEIGIPAEVTSQEREFLLQPYHPLVEIKTRRDMSDEIPEDFDAILELLK